MTFYISALEILLLTYLRTYLHVYNGRHIKIIKGLIRTRLDVLTFQYILTFFSSTTSTTPAPLASYGIVDIAYVYVVAGK